jgi:hypothetical protein
MATTAKPVPTTPAAPAKESKTKADPAIAFKARASKSVRRALKSIEAVGKLANRKGYDMVTVDKMFTALDNGLTSARERFNGAAEAGFTLD